MVKALCTGTFETHSTLLLFLVPILVICIGVNTIFGCATCTKIDCKEVVIMNVL